MPRASSAAENVALTALQTYSWQSLTTTDPTTTGATEVTGGSYARQSETWGTPSAGVMANSAAITQNVPATTVAGVGHWTAVTAGTYGVGALLGSSVTFSTAGTLTFAIGADTITIA